MSIVIRPISNRLVRFWRERPADAGTESRDDPDSIISQMEANARAFERLANGQNSGPMQNAYREMADACRRASKDVSRIWRDVSG